MLSRRNTIKGLAASCFGLLGFNQKLSASDLPIYDMSDKTWQQKKIATVQILKLRKSHNYDHRTELLELYNIYEVCIASSVFGIDYIVLLIRKDNSKSIECLESCFENFDQEITYSEYYELKSGIILNISGKISNNAWTFGRKEIRIDSSYVLSNSMRIVHILGK